MNAKTWPWNQINWSLYIHFSWNSWGMNEWMSECIYFIEYHVYRKSICIEPATSTAHLLTECFKITITILQIEIMSQSNEWANFAKLSPSLSLTRLGWASLNLAKSSTHPPRIVVRIAISRFWSNFKQRVLGTYTTDCNCTPQHLSRQHLYWGHLSI